MREGCEVLRVYPPQLHPLLELASLYLCDLPSVPASLQEGDFLAPSEPGPWPFPHSPTWKAKESEWGLERNQLLDFPALREGRTLSAGACPAGMELLVCPTAPEQYPHLRLGNNNPIRKLHVQQ